MLVKKQKIDYESERMKKFLALIIDFAKEKAIKEIRQKELQKTKIQK